MQSNQDLCTVHDLHISDHLVDDIQRLLELVSLKVGLVQMSKGKMRWWKMDRVVILTKII